MTKQLKLSSANSRIITVNKAKDELHKIWLLYPNVEVIGRLTDVVNIDTTDGLSGYKYELPGIRFRTRQPIKDSVSPPSVLDYINIMTHKRTEYILTEHGIWMIQPIRTTTFITECALAYYVFILNRQLTQEKYAEFPSLLKHRDIKYLTKIYSKLMTDPDGRLLNINQENMKKTAIKETVNFISSLYPTKQTDIIKSSILSGMSQFIGDPPVKVTWHSY